MTRRVRTWLSAAADRAAEAAWLVGLVMVPLYFNVRSSRVFEPEKIASLRLIAVLLALALVAKGVDAAVTSAGLRAFLMRVWRSVKDTPLLLLSLLFVVSHALSTFLSVVPQESLWGSYARVHGLISTAAGVILFLAVLAALRAREQVERLITTALAVSFAVALYGIIQHVGQDPVPWSGDVVRRVASSLGNPIFAGAFLIMTIPLSLYRLITAGSAVRVARQSDMRWILIAGGLISLAFQLVSWNASPIAGTVSAAITVGAWVTVAGILGTPTMPLVRVSIYTVVLAAQLMCVLFSQSRGPWLGLAAGLVLFSLLWMLSLRRWRMVMLTVGLASTLGVGVVALNVASPDWRFVQESPYLERVGNLFDAQSTGRVRILIWEGSAELITSTPARAAVGYGPEAMRSVYPPFYPPELGRLEDVHAIPDRAHNETFDAAISTGLIGLALYLLIFVGLFHVGLKALGLVSTRRERWALFALMGAGGAGLLVGVHVLDASWRFAGVALPAGVALGLLVYLIGYGVRGLRARAHGATPALSALDLLVIALLSALFAHFVEIQVGIAIVATRTTFWVLAGVLVVTGHRLLRPQAPQPDGAGLEADAPAPPERAPIRSDLDERKSRPFWREVGGAVRRTLAAGLIVGMVVAMLGYNFIGLQDPQTGAIGVLWLLVFTWLFGGMAVLVESATLQGAARTRASAVLQAAAFLIAAVAVPVGLFLLHPTRFGGLGDDFYLAAMPYLFMLVLIALLAVALPASTWHPRISVLGAVVGACTTAVVLAGVLPIFVLGIQADVHYRDAQQADRGAPDSDAAIVSAQRALQLDPRREQFHTVLAEAYMQKALDSETPEDREESFRRAEETLQNVRALNAMTVDHVVNLGRLHRIRAQATESASEHDEYLQRALSLYISATAMSPRTPYLWNERGRIHVLMGENEDAFESYRQALELDGEFYATYVHIGDLHFVQERWDEAAAAYAAALERNPRAVQAQLSLEIARARMARAGGAGE